MSQKRTSALLLAAAVSMACGISHPAPAAAQPSADSYPVSYNISPRDWFAATGEPSDYAVGVDNTVQLNGKDSGFVKSKIPGAQGFGTLMQVFTAKPFRGKRARMTAMVKTFNVRGWAALWMRVDAPHSHDATYGTMARNPIRGTNDWQPYEVEIDVPQDCELITLALVVTGHGRAWINDIRLEALPQ